MKKIASLLATSILACTFPVGCAGGPEKTGAPSVLQRLSSAGPGNAQREAAALDNQIARGRALEQAGSWEKAHTLYTELASRQGENAELSHRLGVVCDQLKRHAEAQSHYTEAIRLEPQDAEKFNDLGYCFYLQGKLDKAESALRKAISLNSEAARFHNNLGLVLGHQSRYQEALAEFSQAGAEADAYFNLAFVYAAQGRNDQAKDCFQNAVTIDPRHAKAKRALESFREFEVAGELLDPLDLKDDGVRYVPFVENGDQRGAQGAAQVSFDASSTPKARATGNALRSLNQRGQTLLDRRTPPPDTPPAQL